MPQNNIINFPGPKERSSMPKKKPAKKPEKKSENQALSAIGAGSALSMKDNIIPFGTKNTQKPKKPSKNPYKAWSEKGPAGEDSSSSKEPDLIQWPSSAGAGDQKPQKKNPYVFAGTGLSFLLLVAGLMVLNQKKSTDRHIASAGDYISSIKIVKDGVRHNLLLHKNRRGKLSVSLIPEDNRQLSSVQDSEDSQKPTDESAEEPEVSVKRNPDNEDLPSTKAHWRGHEKRALYLIKTGQRKIVQMGRQPYK